MSNSGVVCQILVALYRAMRLRFRYGFESCDANQQDLTHLQKLLEWTLCVYVGCSALTQKFGIRGTHCKMSATHRQALDKFRQPFFCYHLCQRVALGGACVCVCVSVYLSARLSKCVACSFWAIQASPCCLAFLSDGYSLPQ